jgi:Cu+-exporting ATPase
MKPQHIEWTVRGMDCSNCAISIHRFLELKGMNEIFVDFASGEVRFDIPANKAIDLSVLKQGLGKLGYAVVEPEETPPFWTLERKVLFSAVLTLPLLLDHLIMMVMGHEAAFLHNPWLQFALCLPVYALGLVHFGGSALGSLRGGVPNMDVLIFLGSSAAFFYSLTGAILQEPNYIFFETAATIITLVLVGNLLEKRAVRQTTSAIDELSKLGTSSARKLMPSGTVVTINQQDIQAGDLLLVNEGDQIPADGLLVKGQGYADESMLTGESEPLLKEAGSSLIGGSTLRAGSIQLEVKAVGSDSVLSQMIALVKNAQAEKPDIQRLADRISAVFVPVVVGIALLTWLLSYWFFALEPRQAIMNAIAVLVISCPCAMGLATPTAVSVGVGRLARNGILVKGAQTMETFASIRTFLFDKTGTLTQGNFQLLDAWHAGQLPEDVVEGIVHELEQHSSHPIAQSLTRIFEPAKDYAFRLEQVKERKGNGLEGTDSKGNLWKLGSRAWVDAQYPFNPKHSLLLSRNGEVVASFEIGDALRPDTPHTLNYLKAQGMDVRILSGDREEKTRALAEELGIEHYYAAHSPAQKLEQVQALSLAQPTAMIGDGINDAPALARATIGVSLSQASTVAIQSAHIVLLDGQISRLVQAVGISQATLRTIKENLFWAFSYNIVAIPLAAFGYLTPMWAAFFMAFSDLVVIGNSIRLKYKNLHLPRYQAVNEKKISTL